MVNPIEINYVSNSVYLLALNTLTVFRTTNILKINILYLQSKINYSTSTIEHHNTTLVTIRGIFTTLILVNHYWLVFLYSMLALILHFRSFLVPSLHT